MKQDFNDIFTDIDDKLIAQAKPEAQKPMELRSGTRPKIALWKKLSVAAACLTAAAVGGVFAVNGIRSANSLPSTSIPEQSATISSNDSGSGAADSTVPLLTTITPENDVTYNVISSKSFNGVNAYVGLKEDTYARGSLVLGIVAIENTTDKPIAFAKSDDVNVNVNGLRKTGWGDVNYDEQGNPITVDTIKPGETYYRYFNFDTCKTERLNGDLGSEDYKTKDLVEGGTYYGTMEMSFLSDPEDSESEVITNTLDFSIEIENFNMADCFTGYTKYLTKDEFINRFGSDTFTIRNDFPGDEFELDYRSVYLLNDDGTKTRLFGGKYINHVNVCDVNDDGYGDIVADVCCSDNGETAWDSRTVVYDHANKKFYTVSGYDKYELSSGVDISGAGYSDILGISMHTKGDVFKCIFSDRLTFDMLTPCVINAKGEPELDEAKASELIPEVLEKFSAIPEKELNTADYLEIVGTDNSHNDDIIHLAGMDYTVLGTEEYDGMKMYFGADQDGEIINAAAAIENTSDKPIKLYVPYTRGDDPNLNTLGAHSEVSVMIRSKNVLGDMDEDYYAVKHEEYLLVLQPGETYYQRMRFATPGKCYEDEMPEDYDMSIPAGNYNGTAMAVVVDDNGEPSSCELEFDFIVSE